MNTGMTMRRGVTVATIGIAILGGMTVAAPAHADATATAFSAQPNTGPAVPAAHSPAAEAQKAAGALPAESGAQGQAAQQCRNAYVSTTGAWGSARICWTSLGNNFYKARATGTVKDTKGDGKRAALYIKTYDTSGHYYTPRLALATKNGQVKYGSWSSDKVKWGVYIYVCRVDRFNNTYNCSNAG